MRIVISILVVIALPIMSLADGNADSGAIGPIIKGLYIGMDSGEAQEVAIQIAQEICGNDIKKKITAYNDYTTFSVDCKGYLSIDYDKQNKVNKIILPLKLFGASDWTLNEFAQAFINAYNIPELDIKQEYRSSGRMVTIYSYNDREAGYSITIDDFLIRTVVIKRISKTDDVKFN